MTFDFLAPDGKKTVVAAQRLARSRDEEAVELEHLLLALLEAPDAAVVVQAAGADIDLLRTRIETALRGVPKSPGAKVFLGERVLRLFDLAQVDARERGDKAVGPLHLLAAIPLETRSGAALLLREQGVTLPALEDAIAKRSARTALPGPAAAATNAGSTNAAAAGKSGPPAGGPATGGATAAANPSATPPGDAAPLLAKYARDLTEAARSGQIDPIVGRDLETRRLMQILGRHNKNNPIVIGDPGVGKTAIVEGLAVRIATGDVPAALRDKRILALDVGALVAGAKFRGDFEDRIRGIIAEVRDADGQIILFFDEIHTLMGAGQGEGGVDAADLLKPALARGEITCIGSTTLDEYRLHIEKDPAFERRFLPVMIEEPDEETSIGMLRAVKRRYENRHHVRIQDATLVAAVKLSRRYVAGRALPDKAIDLLDEAGSRLRLELDSQPDEIDLLERRRNAIAVELSATRGDRDPETRERSARLERSAAEIEARLGPMREQWRAELAAIATLQEAARSLRDTGAEAQVAERAGDLNRASELRNARLPELEVAQAAAEEKLRAVQGKERLLEDAVEPIHVARVVGDWTGIPVARMLEGERQKILAIESKLAERVVGQEDAVRLVGHAIKRSRAGLADAGRPIGSFLFLGPTGVGKTELTKALAEFLFDDDHALCRLDMSEYMEKHSVARLTGAPPGYVGFEDGGQLTEAVRRRPYSVVLFDEVEKAHPDVFNVLLALLDDGRLTDSRGRTVGFSNTVLIMTSNLGAQAILAAAGAGDRATIEQEVKAALRSHFRPEFLNRIDETVIFNPLGRPQIEAIVRLQLGRIVAALAEQRISIEVTPPALAVLAEESYDPAFGARPVKRALQRRLRDPLAEKILAGEFGKGDGVRVIAVGRELRFEKIVAPVG